MRAGRARRAFVCDTWHQRSPAVRIFVVAVHRTLTPIASGRTVGALVFILVFSHCPFAAQAGFRRAWLACVLRRPRRCRLRHTRALAGSRPAHLALPSSRPVCGPLAGGVSHHQSVGEQGEAWSQTRAASRLCTAERQRRQMVSGWYAAAASARQALPGRTSLVTSSTSSGQGSEPHLKE